MTEPSHAVFLSYASQDAEAAQRICDALRAGGIEVWFDQSELRGGDAWDRHIRQQIHDCRLFIAVISAHSDARHEGYFRREWRLAVERTGDMSERVAFLVPLVIDDTSDSRADVPDRFREVQCTRLPGGEATPAFVERIKRLLSPEAPTAARSPANAVSGSSSIPVTTGRPSPWKRAVPVAVAVVVIAALAYGLISKPWISKPTPPQATSNATSSPAATPTAFNPPPHSIAVLPFVNMSGDKDQEYFSEGLTEELLNSLARINELQVAARTSSFSFQGEHPDLATVARKLNVASVLEGSVRRSGHTIRVTAQLNNAMTGFHMWSQTYDRDLGDVLKLQTELATAVAGALKITLLGDAVARIEVGATHNPPAFDAYLRGWNVFYEAHQPSEFQVAAQLQSRAIELDPEYALAYAARAIAFGNYAVTLVNFADPKSFTTARAARDTALDAALSDARKAIALAPQLGEGYSALGFALAQGLKFRSAEQAVERSLTLAVGNARVLRLYGYVIAPLGRTDAAISTARQARQLDPVNQQSDYNLASALCLGRQYREALATLQSAGVADPEWADLDIVNRGTIYYAVGDYEAARTSCEMNTRDVLNLTCLAMTYDKVGRHAEAQEMLNKIRVLSGDAALYQYARAYAQWGSIAMALDCLDTAVRVRDVDLQYMKMDPLLDPLRNEPRFKAIERELKFPD